MLATSPSPNLESAGPIFSRPQYDQPAKPLNQTRPAVKHHDPGRKYHFSPDLSYKAPRNASTRSLDRYSPSFRPRNMVDKGTQWSPPGQKAPTPPGTKTPTSTIAGLQLTEKEEPKRPTGLALQPAQAGGGERSPTESTSTLKMANEGHGQAKRQAVEAAAETSPGQNGVKPPTEDPMSQTPVKKARPDTPPVRLMPRQYENCNTRDLVILISSMLMELIRYNDAIPLREGQLTRFHSRAPPGISVLDYLQRLTTHATLSPPILLSVVYYIDRLCALYPAFTISSLTVHRFLITSATVASKGLSDSFWTNKTYARVGGVSMKELALLELEFLTRMEWRIVPKPEVLCDYYRSLIQRNSQYQLED
ncbi:Pho80p cyclin [Exophiala dermatitidis]|uniref:Phosphate system cyclin PHO80 n=2 Tax=Exophiala dermatitidis TaxID=5970 RepID=H6CC33_EXODN|nr:phosphate system cyclin PHO80 [Exophiala dermatitidis NIH/UT8656]KAJ4503435.1 Pho80p cyclin [Exophiala dermatitidis]EHY61330.1 phosphate system cyclin PHO80 [Exophiala dermatitidis NIH/UT8656]KAJ4504037.1 Pho80p cyclin [Exophiala dermatitidis]KAJ4528976.1 Pho80p cyclin [Exophiala dermatitidis]KAJ4533202.1 Pho80p cyclin [Exophiala dermatitidis]